MTAKSRKSAWGYCKQRSIQSNGFIGEEIRWQLLLKLRIYIPKLCIMICDIKQLLGWNFVLCNITLPYIIYIHGLITINDELWLFHNTTAMPPNPWWRTPMSPGRIPCLAQPSLLHQVIYARRSKGTFLLTVFDFKPIKKRTHRVDGWVEDPTELTTGYVSEPFAWSEPLYFIWRLYHSPTQKGISCIGIIKRGLYWWIHDEVWFALM